MAAPVFVTPQEAELAFYQAIEDADLDAMMEIWSNEKSIVCIHPGIPRMVGREEVSESWRQLFESEVGLRFSLEEIHYTQDSLLSIHQVREHIEVDGNFTGVMLSTNIYQHIDGSWKMVLHHASPEPDLDDDDIIEAESEPPPILH